MPSTDYTSGDAARAVAWFTVPEAASILRTSDAAIYARIARGHLAAERRGGARLLIPAAAVLPPASIPASPDAPIASPTPPPTARTTGRPWAPPARRKRGGK